MLATPSSLSVARTPPSPAPLVQGLGGPKRSWRGTPAPTAASKGHYHADRRVLSPRKSQLRADRPGGEEYLDAEGCNPKLSVLKARVQGEGWFF